MGKAEGQVCSQEVGSCQAKGPSNDERCGQEEIVRLDESSLGCEEEVGLARYLIVDHWHSCQRIQDSAQVTMTAWTLCRRDQAHTYWCFRRDRLTWSRSEGSALYSFSRALTSMSAAPWGLEASVPGLPIILSSHVGLTGTSTTCERIRASKKSATVSTLGVWNMSGRNTSD